MSLLLEIFFEGCILGLYNWVGKQIYGPDFVNKDKKQPLHRKIFVTAISFFAAIVVTLVLAYLIVGIIELV